MKTIAELEAIRKKAQKDVRLRSGSGDVRVVVGMDNCGIEAGARQITIALMDEINKHNLQDVMVTQTECLGACRLEPMMEVYEGEKKTTYVKLTPELARQIVTEHLVNGKALKSQTIGVFES